MYSYTYIYIYIRIYIYLLTCCPSPNKSYRIMDLHVPWISTACCVRMEACQIRLIGPDGLTDALAAAPDK